MRRREFLGVLGGAAAWPLAARAQQPAMPVVGYIYPSSLEPIANSVVAFRKGLSETGFVEGRNVTIEYRSAHDEYDRLPELAADLVRRRVTVIATPGSTTAALAAKAATTTIPIVFGIGRDPVKDGLRRHISGMCAQRLRPSGVKSTSSPRVPIARSTRLLRACCKNELTASNRRGPPFSQRPAQLATLTVRYALPAIFPDRQYAETGGLMSYGSSGPDMYRQVGIYVGHILKGEKPSELPVLQAAKFELIVNLHTAKLIGINVPPTLLARADEVIE